MIITERVIKLKAWTALGGRLTLLRLSTSRTDICRGATEGRNSNLAEKKFTLARGGTLTCSSRQLHKNNFAVDCLKWQD